MTQLEGEGQTDSPHPKQRKGTGYLIGGVLLWVLFFIAFAGEPSWNVGERLACSFAAATALTFTGWVAVREHVKQKARDKAVGKPMSVKDALVQLSSTGFVPTQKYTNTVSNGIIGIALDERTGNVCFLHRQGRFIDIQIFAPSDILESEVNEDGFSITKTSISSMAGRAIVGGLLLGRLGAVVGGVTAKKSQTNKVKSLELRVIVNDTAQPVRTVNFMSREQKRGSFIHKTALEQANRWHALISVLIKRASKA